MIAVSGDFTFFVGAFHPEEVASKTWYYTISSYTLKRLEIEIYLKEKGIDACFSFGSDESKGVLWGEVKYTHPVFDVKWSVGA